jgi:hypothetical protein
MKFHRTAQQLALWMLSAVALCNLTACFCDSDNDQKDAYWRHAAMEDKSSPTSGDIFGGFN